MSDLISREATLDIVAGIDWYHVNEKGNLVHGSTNDYVSYMKYKDVIKAIERVTEAVVHCKDCAHWKPCEVKGFEGKRYCEWAGWLVGENAYCVYGEKQEG